LGGTFTQQVASERCERHPTRRGENKVGEEDWIFYDQGKKVPKISAFKANSNLPDQEMNL